MASTISDGRSTPPIARFAVGPYPYPSALLRPIWRIRTSFKDFPLSKTASFYDQLQHRLRTVWCCGSGGIRCARFPAGGMRRSEVQRHRHVLGCWRGMAAVMESRENSRGARAYARSGAR